MLDNFLADEEATQADSDVVLQAKVERIKGTEHVSDEEVWGIMLTKTTLVLKVIKRHLKFLGHRRKRAWSTQHSHGI